MFNRTADRGPTDPADIDRALRLISEVLQAEKARGWTVQARDGTVRVVPPLLCIDELNFSEVGSDLLDDAAFWRLLDWLMHISDNRLAHVVLCAGLDAAELLDRCEMGKARRRRGEGEVQV